MKYSDLLDNENVEFYIQPELPKITFKKDKIEYTITDLRYLNENAVNAFESVINYYAKHNFADDVTFQISREFPKEEMRIIIEILTGIHYTMRKKGKGGFLQAGSFLVCGTVCTNDKLTVMCNKDHAKFIHEYYKENKNINFLAMVADVLYKDHLADSEQFMRVCAEEIDPEDAR